MSRWSGEYHIVNGATRESLESWPTQRQADYFCAAVNDHEQGNGRAAVYVVELHSLSWRKGPQCERFGADA